MSRPAARLGDVTVTGDLITAPGAPTVMIGGLPAARMSDSVSGPACKGMVAAGSGTVIIHGQPAARVGDLVAGVNPQTGASVTTTVGPPGAPTVLIGG